MILRRVLAACAAAILVSASVVAVARADDGLDTQWDTDTLHLDWQGEQYSTVESSFFGSRTIVPGDRVERTLSVENQGPVDGLLSVRVLFTRAAFNASDSQGIGNLVSLRWSMEGHTGSVRLGALASGEGFLFTGIPLARSDPSPFVLTLDYPIGATGGNKATSGASEFAFDVQFTIREPGTAKPIPSPSPSGSASPTAGPSVRPSATAAPTEPQRPPSLATTGVLIGASILGLFAAGILGALLVVASRRRRAAPDPHPSDRTGRHDTGQT